MIKIIQKHQGLFTFLGLLAFCYLIFFFGIGSYHLMDIDETRYVLMSRDMFHSKDFMTLYLNGQYFFEKPPLYFWGEILSFLTFGKVTEFTARFPVALYGTLSTLLLYFIGAKVVSRRYGMIAALILATSIEFLILAKYAILDILLATCIEYAICLGFLTFFVKEDNKKYCWWGFYIFSALAVLAKGIPGFVLPFGTMFFASVFMKKFKEIFKPQYFLVGSLLFLLIILPWHIVMLKTYDPLFFNEYIMKHHVSRFFDSAMVNRKQPFYFFLLTILWGFCPWIISCITTFISKIKKWCEFKNLKINVSNLSNIQKYLFLNFIAFAFTMLFFSSSSTKLVTYILPVYFAMANLTAWVWVQYIENNKYQKPIQIASCIFFGIFLIAAASCLFAPLFLSKEIYSLIASVKWFTFAVALIFGSLGLFFAFKNKRVALFVTHIALITVLSAVGIPKYFELNYTFGQNDLMKYCQYAIDNNMKLQTINTGARYSLNYYGPKDVIYSDIDEDNIQKTIDDADKNTLIIMRNKHLKKAENLKYVTIFKGAKYTLLKR